jgi:hypothetical protein
MGHVDELKIRRHGQFRTARSHLSAGSIHENLRGTLQESTSGSDLHKQIGHGRRDGIEISDHVVVTTTDLKLLLSAKDGPTVNAD